MCNIMWLTRLETEYSDRIRVISLGLHYLSDIFKYLKYINILLLLGQIFLRIYEGYFDVVPLSGVCYKSLTFITILLLSLWVIDSLLLLYSDGSKHFYCSALKAVKRCKATEGDTNKLKEYLQREKMIHTRCVRGVIYRKNRYIFEVTFLIFCQLIIYYGQPV